MNKSKILFRSLYSIVITLIVFILGSELFSDGVVGFPQYVVYICPLFLLWCFNIFNTIMYVLYCIKHKDEKVGFVNKDTSKIRKAIRIAILILVALSMISVFVSLSNKNKTEIFNGKIAFVKENLVFDSCTDVDENPIAVSSKFSLDSQFAYLWYYSSEGIYTVTDNNSNETLCRARIEYAKQLPLLCKNEVFDKLYKDSITSNSRQDKQNIEKDEITHDGFKISYVFSKEDNVIHLFVSNSKSCVCIFENWEDDLVIDIEKRIIEWENVLNNIE